jgi:dTDP-4-dehydrorhamnose reductase
MLKKKIYIAGAGGMLGEAFHNVLNEDYKLKCTDKDVNEGWISFMDFRNNLNYRRDVVNFKPDYLFHIGAYTDLEFCENNVDDTYNTNTTAVKHAVQIANKLHIPIMYVSTAGIFDGNKSCYDETDTPNPLGHYARSKYLGEQYVMKHANRYLICRAGWMMGGGPEKDKKFIHKLARQLAAGSRDLYVVDDKDGTPTFTIDFARNVKLLLENEKWGLYNMVCSGQTSRYEVATELLNSLGMKDQVKLHKVSSDYFKQTYFAARPPSERLINHNLDLLGLNIMRDWKVALKEYVDVYYQNYFTRTVTTRKKAA